MAKGKLTILIDPVTGRTLYDIDHPAETCEEDADALEALLAILGCDEPGHDPRRSRRPRQSEGLPPQKNRQGHGD